MWSISEEDAMRMKFMLPVAAVLTLLLDATAFAAPVVVACGPGQHAIVRDGFVRGRPATRVACVSRASHPSYASSTRYDYRTRYGTPYHAARGHRSWGKSALIIGGSAGTGAGIGGIVGGKKGALVGAALGGGVASIYEGRHRR
jgi:hypothetical protein